MEVTHLPAWIESVKHLLQPPVGNKMLYGEGQMQAFIVGGPNTRKDFHIEEGEEFFFQLRGDMRLDVMERGALRQIPIREGEVFMLPARIPHSPQRFADTVGFVVERKRHEGEFDGLRWYVGDSSVILYEEWFHCTSLGTQIKEAIERFFASDDYKAGKPSRAYTDPKVQVNETLELPAPFPLRQWLEQNPHKEMMFDGEFKVRVARDSPKNEEWKTHKGEVLFLQITGNATVRVRKEGEEGEKSHELGPDCTFLVREGESFCTERSGKDSVGLELYSTL